MAKGDIGVQRRMLEAGRCLDGRDDLACHAELGEAAKRRLLVGPEVPHRLVEPDQALLDEVLGVTARQEVRTRLEADETGVAADQNVERPAVAVPGAQHELEIFELPLGLLRSGCGPCGHLASPGVRGETRSLTLRLREKIARSAALYKLFAVDPGCHERTFVSSAGTIDLGPFPHQPAITGNARRNEHAGPEFGLVEQLEPARTEDVEAVGAQL